MQPVVVTVLCFVVYVLFYRFYARHLGRRVFKLDSDRPTPAHTMGDGVDYVPSSKPVLFRASLRLHSRIGPDARSCYRGHLGLAAGDAVGGSRDRCHWSGS